MAGKNASSTSEIANYAPLRLYYCPGGSFPLSTRRVRLILVILSLVVVGASLVLLASALAPGETIRIQATLAATVFLPP